MSYKQLTEVERYQIYTLMKVGKKQNEIAHQLGRHPSTISREFGRNRGLKGYRPAQAHRLTQARRQSAYKHRKLTEEVKDWIIRLLRQDLSPEQVVCYLRRHRSVSLHHETIYQLIYEDRSEGGDLYRHLRIVSKPYRKRYGYYDRRGRIKDRVSIEQRPSIVEQKSRVGDWEGDTMIGKNRSSALLTLVERKTLYTVIIKLQGKQADQLAHNFIHTMRPLRSYLKTLTLDNGLEFSEHQRIAEQLELDIYFAHPYCSWERGINENINGLIRQYLPKGTDFNTVTEEQLIWIMERLNNRPRITRDGYTPNELFWGQPCDLLAA